jgi:MFS family permease
MVLPLIVLPALWGTLILEHYHHVDFANSAWILSFFFFGTITGSLSKAALSLHITGVRLLRIAIATEFFSLFLFVFNPTRSHGMLALSCFFIGLAASFMLLIFTFIQKKISQPALSIVIVNVTVLLISVCFQPLMGWYLDYTSSLNWSLEISLKTALLVLPLVLIPAYTVTHHLTD